MTFDKVNEVIPVYSAGRLGVNSPDLTLNRVNEVKPHSPWLLDQASRFYSNNLCLEFIFLMALVCLSVCLQKKHSKCYGQIFMKLSMLTIAQGTDDLGLMVIQGFLKDVCILMLIISIGGENSCN